MFLEYVSRRTYNLVAWSSVAQTSFDELIDIESGEKLFHPF